MPRQTKTAPATASAACACSRSRIGPAKSTSSSIANEPNAANVATVGLPITLSPRANIAGITSAGWRSSSPRCRSASTSGFGQPMEHVLRQCLIALRLAERIGLDEQGRAVVYYTALLVNVGCHSDAHEQAKWFGDDIALKSGKYDHEPGACGRRRRACGCWAPATRRCIASGSGSSSRSPGHREVDDMIAQHAAMARTLGRAARAARRGARGPRRGVRAVGRARLAGRAQGRGRAGRVEARAAGGVRRGRAPGRRGRGGEGARPESAAASSSTPRWRS